MDAELILNNIYNAFDPFQPLLAGDPLVLPMIMVQTPDG